ncbi:PepSY domain-containing protein [Alteromonas sp. C1M14]|uniref:PepSY-associated TM helix domain-containing protein n=1 Tax=Alteromonas sp. C1M14 TaxID=2841567 RepID=UPI001C096E8B|nr:PepSY domain-containing protein [Alteromonas sp. C1M14]MBU2978572.1 PepSY domain-containing protein [Alteromonas sp. C1M14]
MTTSRHFHQAVWRWHFYAGIFCIPFILVLAVSGAVYLFKPQLDNWQERHYIVEPQGQPRADASQQLQAALTALPGSRFVTYRLPQSPREAVQIAVQYQGAKWLVYVDPYSLHVLDTRSDNSFISQWFKTLHGELLVGDNGAILVELAGNWAIVLVLTGLLLWWPKKWRKGVGALRFKMASTGRRFWLDFHKVVGAWLLVFILFFLISGLPWTTVWGSAFKQVRTWYAQQQVEQDWTTGPASKRKVWGAMISDTQTLPAHVLNNATALQLPYPTYLSVADHSKQEWKVDSMVQNRPKRETVWLDNEGRVLERRTFEDKARLDRIIGYAIAAHEGHLFGWFNQLLGVTTALGLIVLSISGLYMWLVRRPEGQLGAPPRTQVHGGVITGLIILAMLLPLFALSLIAIWFLERWVFKAKASA